ncbi:MAG: hypothetical protein ACM3VS_13385 [Candidatus Dadabacteria bacterium]
MNTKHQEYRRPRPSSINADWHNKNKMPAKATMDERIRWHLDHMNNCNCRKDLPLSIKEELIKRKTDTII